MRFYLLIFAFLLTSGIHAQDAPVLADRAISEETWEKATDGLDYSDDVKEKAEKEEKEDDSNSTSSTPKGDWSLPNLTGFGTVFQILFIGLGLLLLAYVIYTFIQQPSNRKLTQQTVTIENLDEHLEESDLDRFLRLALEKGAYSDAIRIHFLQIIKDLNEKNYIKWAKEKTNRDYLRELSGKSFLPSMRTQTRIYEKVWYGNMDVDKALYDQLAPNFKALLSRI